MRGLADARKQSARWIGDGIGRPGGAGDRIERDVDMRKPAIGILDDFKIIRRRGIKRHQFNLEFHALKGGDWVYRIISFIQESDPIYVSTLTRQISS